MLLEICFHFGILQPLAPFGTLRIFSSFYNADVPLLFNSKASISLSFYLESLLTPVIGITFAATRLMIAASFWDSIVVSSSRLRLAMLFLSSFSPSIVFEKCD